MSIPLRNLIVPPLHFPLIPLSYECHNTHIAHNQTITSTTTLFVIVAAPDKTAWPDHVLFVPAPTDTVALVVRARGNTGFPLSP